MFRLIIGTFTRMYSVYEIIWQDRRSNRRMSTNKYNMGMLWL